jgi:hypothetical protein
MVDMRKRFNVGIRWLGGFQVQWASALQVESRYCRWVSHAGHVTLTTDMYLHR